MLTNQRDAMLYIHSGQSGCVTSFAITEKLFARGALLLEVLRVTYVISPTTAAIAVCHILPSEPHPDCL